jgi:hypothetical protein
MAGLIQFNSFIGKFVSLWQQGVDANLSVTANAGKAWMQLQVGLGEAQQQEPQEHVRVPGPARLRRRQRRAEKRRQEAEKAKEEKSAEEVTVEETVPIAATNSDVTTRLNDEICTDAEYLKEVSREVAEKATEKKMCSVEIYPKDLTKIEEFRKDVENYFNGRKDVIEEVIDCRIEEFGRRVKLRSVVKMRFGWTSFFNDPGKNYGDLLGIQTVRHGCGNLSQCDPAP